MTRFQDERREEGYQAPTANCKYIDTSLLKSTFWSIDSVPTEVLKKSESRVVVKDCLMACSFSLFFLLFLSTRHLMVVYLAVAVMVGTLPLI